MLRIAFCLFMAVLWTSTSTLAAQPVIHVVPDSAEIQIDAVEPGGCVALLGAHRRLEGYVTVAGGLQQILVDEDRDGSVTVELEIGVPLASLWVAVDLTSGLSSVAWPAEFAALPLTVPTLRLDETENFEASGATLEMSGRLFEVFLVRPGEASGIWHQTLANGGPMDADPDPASMSLRLDRLESLAEDGAEAAPAPASLGRDDLVILLDPTRLGWQVIQGDTLLEGLPRTSEAAGNAAAGGQR